MWRWRVNQVRQERTDKCADAVCNISEPDHLDTYGQAGHVPHEPRAEKYTMSSVWLHFEAAYNDGCKIYQHVIPRCKQTVITAFHSAKACPLITCSGGHQIFIAFSLLGRGGCVLGLVAWVDAAQACYEQSLLFSIADSVGWISLQTLPPLWKEPRTKMKYWNVFVVSV